MFIVVSSDLCTLNYHFVFSRPVIRQFSKITFFLCAQTVLIFQISLFCFSKIIFLTLLKHYKNRGFSRFLCFFVKREAKSKTRIITGIFGFWVFGPKNGRSWPLTVFQKLVCSNPFLIDFFQCALFWPSCQNRVFWTKKNWKTNFLVFVFLYLFFRV